MNLVKPMMDYRASYESYIKELGAEERYPFTLDFDSSDFAELIRRLEKFEAGIDMPPGLVPNTTFWLVDDGEILGISNLRHRLNDEIRHCGGHIGLGVRPSRRKQNLGTTLMGLTIDEARHRGIEDIHIHCYKHNQASARMIMANGGVLDSEIRHGTPPERIQRFLVRRPQGATAVRNSRR